MLYFLSKSILLVISRSKNTLLFVHSRQSLSYDIYWCRNPGPLTLRGQHRTGTFKEEKCENVKVRLECCGGAKKDSKEKTKSKIKIVEWFSEEGKIRGEAKER